MCSSIHGIMQIINWNIILKQFAFTLMVPHHAKVKQPQKGIVLVSENKIA